MENNTPLEQSADQVDNSGTIFGTSSDSILQGLHDGIFIDSRDASGEPDPGDSSKIVNEQEQNEIVNPDEKEFTENNSIEEVPNTASVKENQGIADEILEGDSVDDGIDDEDEAPNAKS